MCDVRLDHPDPDRQRGAFLGLAVGDAVGATLEFRAPGSFAPIDDMLGGGPFDLPPGAWTDDTSMAACMAQSLVERGGFDRDDQMRRYLAWYRDGHWSSTGRCFDIGGATARALERYEHGGDPYAGSADPDSAGNGSLMRLAPIPIAYARDPARAVALAAESSRTTHGAITCLDACRVFAALTVGAIRGVPKAALLAFGATPVAHLWGDDLQPEVAAIAAGSYLHREPPTIRGRGYVVASLEAALWAVSRTDDYRAAVLAAANLGDDADTTAAIAGQLAGALYGASGIPSAWLERLVMRGELEALADGLVALSTTLAQPTSRQE